MTHSLVLRANDDLIDLLRRCHRAELLPLAEVLEIRPDGLGLGQLASACDRTLRRRGAQDLANIVKRGGEGPSYAEVLNNLAAQQDLPESLDQEAIETRLLEAWVQSSWSSMPVAERERVWRRLQLELPVPAEGHEALVSLGDKLRKGAQYGAGVLALAGLRTLPLLFPPLLPMSGCLTVFWLGRVKSASLLPAVLEVSALRRTVRHRVTIGVVGSPSSGKDAAIKAIFGLDSGNVDPVAGSTREVEITRLEGATALYVVNTPGMGDIIEAVTEEARQVLDLIDVFVYVVNAQGGVQARELADYRACLARERPVLAVVNKIDTLLPADQERYLVDARQKLNAPEENFLAAAFDPLPQLSETPIGLEAVRDWIAEQLLGLGKDPGELPWRERMRTPEINLSREALDGGAEIE